MENPRPEKVAVVDEVRQRFTDSEAVVLTEYRGITVDEIAQLRRALRAVGGDYKIFKNTLVRFAVRDLNLDLEELLTGPTAIAFIPKDGSGDPVAVAKVLRDFAKGNPNLVMKGGVLGDKLLSVDEIKSLSEVAPREELLARLAGGFAAPMVQFAGLLQALPRNFAYGLSALIAKGGAAQGQVETSSESTQQATEAENSEVNSGDAPTGDAAEEVEQSASEDAGSEETDAAAAAEAGTDASVTDSNATEENVPEVTEEG